MSIKLSKFDLMSVFFTFQCYMLSSKKYYPDFFYYQLQQYIYNSFDSVFYISSSVFIKDLKRQSLYAHSSYYEFIFKFINFLTKYIA